MTRFHGTRLHAWRADERGNFAVLSALAAAPLALIVASGISYSNAVTIRTQTQAAADAAVLAANVAFVNGQAKTAQEAQDIASRVFAYNAPAGTRGAGSFTPVTSFSNNKVSTTGTFTGAFPSLFSNLIGDLSVNVAAAASQTLASAAASTGSTGQFSIIGDPHYLVGSTDAFESTCRLTGDPLYTSMYSDANLQINGQCYEVFGAEARLLASTGVATKVYGLWTYNVTVAGHKITMALKSEGGSSWAGDVTIDGKYSGSTMVYSTTIFNDATNGVKVVQKAENIVYQKINGSLTPVSASHAVEITTPQYLLRFTGDPYSLAVSVAMKSGAVCAPPGGFLGQLWSNPSLWDKNYLDFDTSPWGTDYQYSATCSAVASAASSLKLVK